MPLTVDDLVATLRLAPTDGGFRGSQVNTFFQRTYGGQVLAQALLAAYETVAGERVAHSLHAYFLRAAHSSEPIDYEVAVLRDGGAFGTRRVTGSQDGRAVFVMTASFHLPEPGLDHSAEAPRDVPPPEDCGPLQAVMDERYGALPMWHEWDSLDVRFAGDSPDGWMRVWARTQSPLPAGSPDRLHRAILAYLSDLTLLSVSSLPHDIVFISNQVQAASLGHSMWFHRPCRVDEWLLYDTSSPSAHSAIGFSTGRLFQDGVLVASSAQEGLVRVVEDRPILS